MLGQTVWLSKHVEEYSSMVEPLRKIANRYNGCKTADIRHEWSDPKAAKAYSAIKVALCSPPVLRFPDFNKPFVVLVDAAGGFGEAKGGYGACLAQIDDDGNERPIAYANTALNEAQKKFASTEAETSAVMFALRKWRAMLQGNVTIVVTDHKAVSSMIKPDKVFKNRKMANWALDMADYDLIIAQRAGRIHYTPDFLSRHLPTATQEQFEDIYTKAAGQVAAVAHQLTAMQQFDMLSARMAEMRIEHEVQGAVLMDELDDQGKEIQTVKELMKAVEEGNRVLREQPTEQYDDSKLDEFYDMVATTDAEERYH
jgi:ribonuclease HI